MSSRFISIGIFFLFVSSFFHGHFSRPIQEDESSSGKVCLTPACVIAAGNLLMAMNTSADPCDDFYQFACGNFELHHSISAGESRFKQYNVVDRIIQRHLRQLLEAAATDDDDDDNDENSARHKARLTYKACMDVEAIDKVAVVRMKQMVDELGGFFLQPGDQLPESWSLNALLAARNRFTFAGPFWTNVGPDDMDVVANVIKLEQAGLGLGIGSRDYYLHLNVTENHILRSYTTMLESFARTILGVEDEAVVDRSLVVDVVEFEKKLAEVHRPQTEQENVAETYFKCDIRWLRQHANFMDWRRYFADLFAAVDIEIQLSEPIVLYNAPYFQDLAKLMRHYLDTEKGRRTLQNYFVFRAVSAHAPYLGGEFLKARDHHLAVMMGKKGSHDRWKVCIANTDSVVGFALGAMYIENYFSPSDKHHIETVIKYVVKAFRDRIQRASWMDYATKTKALEKVDAMVFDVGYPDWLRNQTYLDNYYANLTVTDDFTLNQLLSFTFATKELLSSLRHRPDFSKWAMTPHTINAYYEQTENKIVIPAGILNSPYFYAADGIPTALNYGAIGSVAGHEISHAFDKIGREYDKLGNLQNWWTNATRRRYEKKAKCLIDKFNGYEFDGMHLHGDLTLNENIADDGAVKCSYQAYKKAQADGKIDDAPALVGVDLTQDQLFFLGWAQTWCSIVTPETIRYLIKQDEHALYSFRVAGPLSNSPDFAKAFNCPIGSRMNPRRKCSIW